MRKQEDGEVESIRKVARRGGRAPRYTAIWYFVTPDGGLVSWNPLPHGSLAEEFWRCPGATSGKRKPATVKYIVYLFLRS